MGYRITEKLVINWQNFAKFDLNLSLLSEYDRKVLLGLWLKSLFFLNFVSVFWPICPKIFLVNWIIFGYLLM